MSLPVINPAHGEKVADLPVDGPDDVRAKVDAARRAQSAWAARPLDQRIAAIRRCRELVVKRQEELAVKLTTEVGKPIRQSRSELDSSLPRFDFFIEHSAAVLAGETVLSDTSMTERIQLEPLGLVANISAWNYPWFVGLNVILPALIAGNAVLYKPSEYASLTGLAIADLLRESGVPPDVFPVLVGNGEVGAALLDHRMNGVFFTGSYATGLRVAQAAARSLAHVQLELGGKDPTYVCEDVDVAAAAASVADGAFYNTGQSCCAVERIYVHESIYDRFLEAFVATVKGFSLGDPRDESTYIGPLARRDPAIALMQEQTADALEKGARLLAGGHRVDRPGWFFEPTVLAEATHDMRVMREESFGPIIGIQSVSGDEEAAGLMADTEYGLTAGVYTPDTARAERLLAGLQVGSAYVNCCDRVSPRLPWSGRGHSGVGCTLSTHGIRAFVQTRGWHLRSP